ncbi:MAG: phosphoheptose isomerase, partial [Bacteroidales bacterium]|nr:phosphoheptose isomerase [Bacteroidales bacterium]
MYNPFPFHDQKAVNRPELSKKTIDSIVAGGTPKVAKALVASVADKVIKEGAIIAIDGYTAAKWDLLVSLVARECDVREFKIEFVDSYARTFKSGEQIDSIIDPLLIWDKKIDPTLLYGKVYHGGYIGLMDPGKVDAFKKEVPSLKTPGKLVVVYGYGSLIKEFRDMYDVKCWMDITPMNSMLRIRAGEYSNLGKKHSGIINRTIRRCYYCDFENAVQLRKELFAQNAIDWYILDNDRTNLQMMPFESFADICAQLVKYPFRAKPCYLEGVWGGSYMKKLRNLPENMRNAA